MNGQLDMSTGTVFPPIIQLLSPIIHANGPDIVMKLYNNIILLLGLNHHEMYYLPLKWDNIQ